MNLYDYLQIPQTEWLIADETEANWFLIHVMNANIYKYTVSRGDYFYEFTLNAPEYNLLKLKKTWSKRKEVSQPFSLFAAVHALQDLKEKPIGEKVTIRMESHAKCSDSCLYLKEVGFKELNQFKKSLY